MASINTTIHFTVPFSSNPKQHIHATAHFPASIPPPGVASDPVDRIAVILTHPYAKLGGDSNNHVVDFLANAIANGGILRQDGSHHVYYPPSIVNGEYPEDLIQPSPQDAHQRDGQGVKETPEASGTPTTAQHEDGTPSPPTPTPTSPTPVTSMTSKTDGRLYAEPLASSRLAPHLQPIMIRFDFQGAGATPGDSTWMGNDEVHNLIDVYNHVIDPAKEIKATHVYVVGYSFGACVAGSFLHTMAARSREAGRDLLSAFRGLVCIGYPCGLVARFMFGSHITRLRQGAAFIHARSVGGGGVIAHDDAPTPTATPTATIDAVVPIPLSQPPNPAGLSTAEIVMISADDDQFTNTSTLAWVFRSIPLPHKALVVLEEGGHDFFAQHQLPVLCHYISTYIDARQTLYMHQQQQQQQEPTDKTQSTTTTTALSTPSPVASYGTHFTDTFIQSTIWDLNLWILLPLTIFLLLRIAYNFQLPQP